MSYSVGEFVSDVDATLEGKGETMETMRTLGPLLQKLVAEGGDLTLQGEGTSGSSGLPGRVLHVDPTGRFRLVVARFASGEPTPVHGHKRWGLEVGISGKERFTVWESASSDPSKLTVFSDHHIEPGDLGYWYDAPRNIHRQWAEGVEPSCVVILMGGDGSRSHLFDMAGGTMVPA
jgi:predicted metal-dependent enzyme (double-stranded beta helix superfamily)